MKKFCQIGFSIFIVFHLFGAIITPNGFSYLNYTLGKFYRPYMSFLGLGSSWGFFAPEPVAPPTYIDYVISLPDGDLINGRFPSEKDPYFFRDRQTRRIGIARFMVSSENYIHNMFMNYLCHKYPATISTKLWKVTGTSPSLEMVQKGEKKITDTVDLKMEELGTYYCNKEKE